MAPNARAGLASARYDERHRQVRVSFFSPEAVPFTRSYKFFPVLYVDAQALPLSSLREAFALYNPSKFSVQPANEFALEVKASTFSDLLKLTRLLDSMFGYAAKPLEPERQFLLKQGWSYLDSFDLPPLPAACEPEKIPGPALPAVRLDCLADPLPVELARLCASESLSPSGQDAVRTFTKKLAYANLLALPPSTCPDTPAQAAEYFLQNVFFRAGLPLRAQGASFTALSSSKSPAMAASAFSLDSTELDFSQTLSRQLSGNPYNLGFETLNCACCIPSELAASAAFPASADNLLPDSKLAVSFSRDGIYFQSFHDGFAKSFHASQPGKLNRERFREESRLSRFPVGPFLRNQSALLLLPDALELVHRGKAALLKAQGHSLKWFCRRRASTLSAAFRELLALHGTISTQLAEREGKAAAHSLAAHALLATNPEFRYLESLRAATTELLARIPAQLTDSRSIFYFEPLASSVEAVQALTLNRFKEFALERGGKWLGSKQAQAFFSHERPLTLVKEFSAAEALPLASMALSPRRFRTFKRP